MRSLIPTYFSTFITAFILLLTGGCTKEVDEAIEKIWRLTRPMGTYQVGPNPTSFAIADFNEDGNTDLLVTNISGNSLSLLRGNGDGTFQDTTTIQEGDMPRIIVAHDFNQDGHQDFALGNGGDETLSINLGRGDGTFAKGQEFSTHRPTLDIDLYDYNRDGKMDMAVALKSDKIEILLGQGDGTFLKAEVLEVQDSPTSISTADYNEDGYADLAVANNGAMSNRVSVFLGMGDGNFQISGHFGTGLRPLFVDSGDYDNDGKLDLTIVNGNNHTLSFMAGNGDGTFQTAQNFGAGVAPAASITRDVNRDGNLDLFVINTTGGTMDLLLGKGDGTFQHPPIGYKTERGPFFIKEIEFTPGGSRGIIVVNNTHHSISVFAITVPRVPIHTRQAS